METATKELRKGGGVPTTLRGSAIANLDDFMRQGKYCEI